MHVCTCACTRTYQALGDCIEMSRNSSDVYPLPCHTIVPRTYCCTCRTQMELCVVDCLNFKSFFIALWLVISGLTVTVITVRVVLSCSTTGRHASGRPQAPRQQVRCSQVPRQQLCRQQVPSKVSMGRVDNFRDDTFTYCTWYACTSRCSFIVLCKMYSKVSCMYMHVYIYVQLEYSGKYSNGAKYASEK